MEVHHKLAARHAMAFLMLIEVIGLLVAVVAKMFRHRGNTLFLPCGQRSAVTAQNEECKAVLIARFHSR